MALDERADGLRGVRRRRRRPAGRLFVSDGFSAGAVRRFLSDVLDDWGVGAGLSRDNLLLLASELASNAVKHASASFAVSIQSVGMRARVEVRDTNPHLPTRGEPSMDADRGHGLVIVDRLASAWGAERTPAAGKVVWFELPLDGDAYTSRS